MPSTYSGDRRATRPEALALADREAVDAVVACRARARRRRRSSPARRRPARALDERRVVAVGDEADLLAVRLVGDAAARAARAYSRTSSLSSVADREHARARAAPASARTGNTTGPSPASTPRCSTIAAGRRVALDARVVAGRDRVGAEAAARARRSVANFRSLLQCAQGIGVRPAAYSRDEVRDDLLVELPLEVHDVVRNVDRRRDAPRVVQIVERAAAAERASAPLASDRRAASTGR